VILLADEFVVAMMDVEMFAGADVHQSVIAIPRMMTCNVALEALSTISAWTQSLRLSRLETMVLPDAPCSRLPRMRLGISSKPGGSDAHPEGTDTPRRDAVGDHACLEASPHDQFKSNALSTDAHSSTIMPVQKT